MMDRNTALEKLAERFAEEKERLSQAFEAHVTEHYEELIKKLYAGIRKLDTQHPIRVIQFQIMRADLYQGKCCIRVCGYDENWYMDEKRCEYDLEMPEWYVPFQKVIDQLDKESYVYMGAVTIYDIRNLVCEHFIACFLKAAMQIRQEFLLFDEWAKQNGLQYQPPYRVVWGVYRGAAETLFCMECTGKSADDLKAECERDAKRGRQAHLHKSFVGSKVENAKFSGENFAYLNMKNSHMSRVSLENCMFGQAMFLHAVMEWCSFAQATLYGCNFNEVEGYQLDCRNASITNSCFEKAKLRKGKFDGATLTDITFADAVLEECSFQNAKLYRVDLRAATLSGIDFTGAKLEDVYIHANDVEHLQLTEEQAEHVYVLKEEVDAVL